ncbi:MAG: rubrerythrin family protein [Dehalococcoidia bacterium]|nr:rubrerythrin family protein [Dehalococcoidia bacterium]
MTTATPADVKRYRRYLNEEVDGLYIYQQLAEIEQEPQLKDVYHRLAETETRHLLLWQEQLRNAGADATAGRPSRRARFMMWAARKGGVDLVLPVIKAFENDATDMYAGDLIAEAAKLPQDEAAHARIFDALSRSREGVHGSVIGRIESRHRALGGGNALRAAVLGANDGLVSNLALVAGFAGAAPRQGAIILAGVAGLLAGASSMALGEWISVTSSREAAEAQIEAEREELRLDPAAEEEELALIYQAKGLPRPEAERLAKLIIADPERAIATLAREELGIVPEELGSPWIAAVVSFMLFSIGAVVPVIPFFFGAGALHIAVSAVVSALALFAVGAGITLLTGRSMLYGGLRQLILGLLAAVLTFVLGSLIGDVTGI